MNLSRFFRWGNSPGALETSPPLSISVPVDIAESTEPSPPSPTGRTASKVDEVSKLVAARFDFTERQARFLVMVMRHSGVCLLRQYSTFAGIVHGQKTRDFFRALVARRYASTYECTHNRARIYHVHYKPLYRTLGEPDHRHRRPPSLGRTVERLMWLDAVLGEPSLDWLASEGEKCDQFEPFVSRPHALPHTTIGSAPDKLRYFPDLLPIGVGRNGSGHVFIYLVTGPVLTGLYGFLERHRELLAAVPAWTLRVVVPPHLSGMGAQACELIRRTLRSTPRGLVAEELRWFFHERRTAEEGAARTRDPRFQRAVRAFGSP